MNRLSLLLLATAGVFPGGPAVANVLDADATGNWYNPDQPGHGLQIEVIDLSQAVLAWYTFDTEGKPLWLIGNGQIAGDTLRAEVRQFAGTRFPPEFDAAEIEAATWGEVIFTRTDCDAAAVEWIPVTDAFSTGQMPLERVTRIDGSHCRRDWSQSLRWRPALESGPAFEALFLDYPDGSEDFYELSWGRSSLPEPWQALTGMRISGDNHSDDLMMVLMRPLDGLEPNTTYRVGLEMQFATQVPDNCVGVGGSPGEGVFMRMGAASEKPDYVVEDGFRRATLDLGQQARPGEDAVSVGDMANGADESFCTGDAPWRLKRVSTADQDFSVTSDETGRIWVYGLSDSGFEATTTWYLTEFVVRLAEAD